MPGIDMLPEELLVEVLKHLSHADRLTCATTSKRFAEALTHPRLLKDMCFTVRGERMGSAAPVLIKSCRRYQSLRLVKARLYEFDSELWGRIGGTLRRLEIDSCTWEFEVLYDIFRECSSLECLGIAYDPVISRPKNPEPCGTSVEDVRKSLSNVKHLHLRTDSVNVVVHLLGLIPSISTISLQVSRGGFDWSTLINRTLADPRLVTELDHSGTGCNLSDADLILLMGAFSGTLRELRLNCRSLTSRAGAAIADCSRLRRLSLVEFHKLENTHMTTILRNNPGLELLDLIDCELLTDDGLSPIHELRNLRRLKIHDYRAITNEFFCRLGEILTLESLDLTCSGLDLKFIQSIACLKNLEELHLDSYAQSSESLRMICMNLGKLQTLYLGDCRYLSDADGLMLSHLRELRTLRVKNASGFKDLGFEGGILGFKMESLTVDGSSLTDFGLLKLVGRYGRLKDISLYGCKNITSQSIMTLLSRAPLLEKLRLRECPYIGNKPIETLGECCPRLRYVDIEYCATTRRALETFHGRRPTVFVSFESLEFVAVDDALRIIRRSWGSLTESSSFLSYHQCH